MKIRKIQLISDNICYGPLPPLDEEVKQHLTIYETGVVWYIGYTYDSGYDGFVMASKKQLNIGKNVAEKICNYFSEYLDSLFFGSFVTCIGTWKLRIVDSDGVVYEKNGSLSGKAYAGEINLTEYIRQNIPIDNLVVFGDNLIEDDDENEDEDEEVSNIE